MPRMPIRALALTLLVVLWAARPAHAETRTIARCGRGFLEEVDGYKVLHVKGTPYEMGYQQGALLQDDIREQVRFLFEVKAKELKVEVGGINAAQPQAGDRRDRRDPEEVRARAVLRGAARGGRRRGDGRPGRHRRQLHPRAVPLLGLRPERLGHEGRHALPRPDPRLRLRLAAPGARGADRRRARGQDPVRQRDLRRVHRLGHRA